MGERWRDGEQTAFGLKETQEWEQPITTLKICWMEFQEVGPPQWGECGVSGGDVGLGYACSYASMGVYVHLCELYVSNSL